MSAHQIAPLPIVIPLLGAALIAMTSFAPRRFHDLVATVTAAASAVLCAVLLAHTRHAPIVEWLGGWRPGHQVALGIALAVDQLGAGCALLVAALVTSMLVYSWSYFDDLDGLVHALFLVLMAGLLGICLTGDLFNMVVMFVLTTVAAIGVTAVENEHEGPLQGAINFAVVNTVAGFALLIGTALLYGRTGALNLAQIALSLQHHPADALVAIALAFVTLGFLTKAGAAPFHFWVPDAQAVAPTPASAMFAGAMVTTMLFGVARLVSTALATPVQEHEAGVRAIVIGLGVVTAVLGAIGCFEQRHLKRMLAFATVSQVGAILCGIGLLRDGALAGAALTALGFGLAIAALFAATGVLLRRYGASDEFVLAGRGHDLPVTGAVFALGALTLTGLPPAATFYGHWLIGDAARHVGYAWLPAVLAVTSAVTAAAVLRAGCRIFLGWGALERDDWRIAHEARSPEDVSEEEERDLQARERPALGLTLIPALLMAAAIAAGPIPGFVTSIEVAAAHFRDVAGYLGAVLSGRTPHYGSSPPAGLDAAAWIYSLGSVAAALLFAWAGLRGRRLVPARFVRPLRAAHSGHVGDYVAWWTFGMAVIGALVLWAVAG